MNNKFIFSFLIVLLLFLSVSCISANENATDAVDLEDDSSQAISQNDMNSNVLGNGSGGDAGYDDSGEGNGSGGGPGSSNDTSGDVENNTSGEGNGTGEADTNASGNQTVIVTKSKTKITASDVVSYKDYKDKFTVKLTSNGKPLANKKVRIVINKVTYNKVTDSKGKVTVSFKLKAGTYNVKFSFLGDNNTPNQTELQK